MGREINLTEQILDEEIEHFRTQLGIVDEGLIVSNDDCEKSLSMDYEDLKLRRA